MAEDLNVEPCGRGDCDCCSCWWRREDALRAELKKITEDYHQAYAHGCQLQLEIERLETYNKGLQTMIDSMNKIHDAIEHTANLDNDYPFDSCSSFAATDYVEWLKVRERRYVEALEKIAEAGCPSQGLNPAGEWQSCGECESCIAKEALHHAPGSQEPVYGPTGVCSEHGVMKERCKCPQEAEAKGCVCSGGTVVHRTDGPCYHAKSRDYIPKEMMK